MSYKIENEEMGFLNKVADELEKLEKEMKFLDVEINDIPKATDRYPYHEEDVASDYPFYFFYKGKAFDVIPTNRKEFALEIKECEGSKSTVKTLTFTMTERKTTIKKIWKDLLKELEVKFDLKDQERYFFYKWCSKQNIAGWKPPEEDLKCAAIYELLTAEISPEEIERLLEERFIKQDNRIDRNVDNKISDSLGIRFYTFLDGMRYFVTNHHNEVFCFKTKEEAFETFEKESIKALKESLYESFENYKNIQNRIDEDEKNRI